MLMLLLIALGMWVAVCFAFVALRLWVAKTNDAENDGARHLDLA